MFFVKQRTWRRERDSNPRYQSPGTHDFQSCPFGQLGHLSVISAQTHSSQPPFQTTKNFFDGSVSPSAAIEISPIFFQGKNIGGEGGIRTHGPSFPGQPISSRPRYNHFGTSPYYDLAPLVKKDPYDLLALLRQHTFGHLHLMIQPRIIKQAIE